MPYNLYTPFEKWGVNGKIWLVSDTHFGDYDEKDWLSAEKIVENIKNVLRKEDTLICLGDCGDPSFFRGINCLHKVLIKGNHDSLSDEEYMSVGGFSEVYSGPLFIAENILLSHEPVYGQLHCLNIHGHMHTGNHNYFDDQGGRHINIVGPAVNYQPMELGELVHLGKTE